MNSKRIKILVISHFVTKIRLLRCLFENERYCFLVLYCVLCASYVLILEAKFVCLGKNFIWLSCIYAWEKTLFGCLVYTVHMFVTFLLMSCCSCRYLLSTLSVERLCIAFMANSKLPVEISFLPQHEET